METIERDGKEYTLRNLKEVTNGARNRVEHLQEDLLDNVLDTGKILSSSMLGTPVAKTNNNDITKIVKEKGLLKEGKTMADLTEAIRFDTYKEEIMAVMLMTDLTYFELTDPKGLYSTLQWLIEEAKKRIGSFEGFTSGLRLNTNSLQAKNITAKTKGARTTKKN